MAFPPATIPNTEVRSLASAVVDQGYRISIALPFDYQTTADRYPVLYLPDANAFFGSVVETVRMLQIFRKMPQLVIVGIGYPVNDFRGTQGLRVRDLTPTKDDAWLEAIVKSPGSDFAAAGTGSADHFLTFIRQELKPFIAANYRINPDDSTIFGYSFGGLFALYTLLHDPDTFQRYMICSPSIWWNPETVFAFEEKFASEHTDLPAKVFLSAGTIEETMTVPVREEQAKFVTHMQKMAAKLQNRSYSGLKLTQHVFEGESHASGPPAALSWGLRVVYSD
jgi:predicted alpha/beta superfamily hydrolase